MLIDGLTDIIYYLLKQIYINYIYQINQLK